MADNPPADTPLSLEDLLAFASIDELDVAEALAWWATHASDTWKEALE